MGDKGQTLYSSLFEPLSDPNLVRLSTFIVNQARLLVVSVYFVILYAFQFIDKYESRNQASISVFII